MDADDTDIVYGSGNKLDDVRTTNDTNDRSDVGYRKPPKANQFAKGRSGNPGGKSKKQVVELNDRVIVRMEARIPNSDHCVIDVLLNRLTKDAANGCFKSIVMMFDLYGAAKKDRSSKIDDDAADLAAARRILELDPRFLADQLEPIVGPKTDDAPAGVEDDT